MGMCGDSWLADRVVLFQGGRVETKGGYGEDLTVLVLGFDDSFVKVRGNLLIWQLVT